MRIVTAVGLALALLLSGTETQTDYNVQATYRYGERLLFRLAGERTNPPSEVALSLSRGGQTFTFVTDTRRTDDTFEAVVTVTPDEIGLAPVETLAYWWAIDEGEQTNVYTVAYQDDVLPWVEEDVGHRIHLVEDSHLTPAEVAAEVDEAIARGEEALNVVYTGRIRVWVYPNTQTLVQALMAHEIRATDWIGAYALPRESAILVTEDNYRADIAHEVTHVILGAALGDGYENVPGWLNEGLALTLQPEGTQGLDASLLEAPLPLEGLCSHSLTGYSAGEAATAYAQSESVVRYIMAVGPPDAISSLLGAYADGAACTEGVEQALGRPFTQFERDWQRWATPVDTSAWGPEWLVLIGLMMGLGALFFGPQLRR